MTDDTHHLDPNDPSADHGYEHGASAEAEAEVWHGEPVDDFGDEAATTAVDDNADSHLEPADQIKKRNPILPAIIVVGGVLFLGAVVYLQFGSMFHSSSTAALPLVSKSAQNKMPGSDVATKSAMVAVPMPSTTTANTATLPTTTQTGVAMPMPAQVSPQGYSTQPPASQLAVAVPNPGVPTLPTPASQEDTSPSVATTPSAAPAPTNFPTVAAAPVTPVVPVASTLPAPSTLSVPTPIASTAQDARMTALSERIDDLQKSMAQATRQLSQISDKMTANQTGSGTSTSAMDDRLNKIEQKLMQMEHTTPSIVDLATTPSGVKSTDEAPVKVASTSTPSTHHKVHHTAVHHKTVKVASSSHHTSKASGPSLHPWVLRAATDDQAWVATDATTSELRPVNVGDELKGIGRVTSIHEGDAGWVIEGTKGSIQ